MVDVMWIRQIIDYSMVQQRPYTKYVANIHLIVIRMAVFGFDISL